MQKLLNYLCGQCLRSLRLLMVCSGLLLMAACSTSPLSLLTGGGPNVAANVQAGETNAQTIGTTELQETSVSVRDNTGGSVVQTQTTNESTRVQADSVETVVVNEIPAWVVLLLVLGWLLPSPNEVGRWIRQWFTNE